MIAAVPTTARMLSKVDQVSARFIETSSSAESRPGLIGIAPTATASASTSAARVKLKHRDNDCVRAAQQLSASLSGPYVRMRRHVCSIGRLSLSGMCSSTADHLPKTRRVVELRSRDGFTLQDYQIRYSPHQSPRPRRERPELMARDELQR